MPIELWKLNVLVPQSRNLAGEVGQKIHGRIDLGLGDTAAKQSICLRLRRRGRDERRRPTRRAHISCRHRYGIEEVRIARRRNNRPILGLRVVREKEK